MIKIKYLANFGQKPHKTHDSDAGFDVFAFSAPVIVGEQYTCSHLYKSIDYIEYDTGLFVEPPPGYFIQAFARSSVSKYNLVLANSVGTIDEDFRNSIKLRFKYIIQPFDLAIRDENVLVNIDFNKIYKKDDKIGQLIIKPRLLDVEFEAADSLSNTERGLGCFGSTNF